HSPYCPAVSFCTFHAGLFLMSQKTCRALRSLSPAEEGPDLFKVGSDPPTACCFTYIPWKIPCNFVMDYYKTSSLCSQPTMIFQTKKSRHACANPSEAWVQDYMNDLELN
uniref:Chemokine interleukin-8-like domain-containing protein n=1 Tax=Myotis lucifugus TaxID=59463 RepID=G1Q3W2_MYOLU